MSQVSPKRLTVVCPAYNEENNLGRFHAAIASILDGLNLDWRILFVDDGSADSTLEALEALCQSDPRVSGLSFSRNFGKEAAMSAGLEHAEGDAVLILDCDLQHPVDLIPEMVRLWREEGYDAVDAVKSRRGSESGFKRFGAEMFTLLMCKLSGFDLAGASDFKLLDRKVVEAWKRMDERQTFYRGMTEWVGFRHARIPFEVLDRSGGTSKWNVLRLVGLAFAALTSFSSLPLHLITILGCFFFVAAGLVTLRALYLWVMGQAAVGFTTVIILQLFIGGILAVSLGIIGEYLSQIFAEVKRRPKYIIGKKI